MKAAEIEGWVRGLKQAPKASKAWGPQRGARLEVAILVASGRASSLDRELDPWRKQQVRLVKSTQQFIITPSTNINE